MYKRMKTMKLKNLFVWVLLLASCAAWAQELGQPRYPKREFRAAWIQTVNGQFKGMTASQMQATLISQLNSLQGRASMPSSSRCAPRPTPSMLRSWSPGVAF